MAKDAIVVQNYQLQESDHTLKLADEVAKFIKEKKLFQNIQGKEYVNVEGWQYAGARLGILAIPISVENQSDENEIKYSASVKLVDIRTQNQVGAGFAVCSNKEQGKKYYQEFAISSMSQTRAIGKAYRNLLAWIIKAAGYEPTPAEEMDYSGNDQSAKAGPKMENAENVTVGNIKEPSTPGKPEPKKRERTEPAVKPIQPEAKPLKVDTAETPATETIKYASAKQKDEIITLLNNPHITRQEKTKMLLNINRFDEERAGQAITKLKEVIQAREEGNAEG